MSFLDLLNLELTPDLSSSELTRLRQILHRERGRSQGVEVPWESGVPTERAPDPDDARARADHEDLEDRVAVLELTVKLLIEALAAARGIDGAAFASRVRTLEQDVARQRKERDALVQCAACGRSVHVSEAVRRATGILCEPCHAGARPAPPPEVRSVTVEGATYRDGPRTVEVEVTEPCVGCGVALTRAEAYRSSRGAVCKKCIVEDEA